jgi:hypothetical protein
MPLFMQGKQSIGANENRERLATPALTQKGTPSSGVADAPIAFPHADTIRSALGTPVPGLALYDRDACAARGVAAFTDRAVSYFATPTPSLRVAAHEGTHQIQHAGFSHDAGLGAEGHADAVAQRLVSGQHARDLVGDTGAAVAPSIRNYTEFNVAEQTAKMQWKVGSLARVGDSGRTVTTTNRRDCYADPALIASANATLKAKNSGIELSAGGSGPSGEAPDGSGWKSLVEVKAKILSSSSGDDYWADCGRASREVQGPTGTDTPSKGVYLDSAGKMTETHADTDPVTYRDEIYVRSGLGTTPTAARAAYLALSPADKDAFDKKHGINKYAAPGIGESFVARRDDMLTAQNFNWHWGAVIMTAGPDRVTFENFAKPGTNYSTKDDKWYFETYGPATKAGQTFHEQNQASVGQPGMNTTTMAARTSPNPADFTGLSTGDLLKRYGASTDKGEKTVLESEMRKRWLKVRIQATKAQEGTDQVYVEVSASGKSHETGWKKISTGGEVTFWISLGKLAPLTGHINIKVYEYDALFDDLISNLGWDYPYPRGADSRPWDGATYITTVEFDR